MSWQPTGNKVVVRVKDVEEVTESGIIISKGQLQKEQAGEMCGTLVALGPTAWHDQPVAWAQIGDRVKFPKFAGWMHSDSTGDYRVMHDLDIILVEVDDE